jgi:hypothetical protein
MLAQEGAYQAPQHGGDKRGEHAHGVAVERERVSGTRCDGCKADCPHGGHEGQRYGSSTNKDSEQQSDYTPDYQ